MRGITRKRCKYAAHKAGLSDKIEALAGIVNQQTKTIDKQTEKFDRQSTMVAQLLNVIVEGVSTFSMAKGSSNMIGSVTSKIDQQCTVVPLAMISLRTKPEVGGSQSAIKMNTGTPHEQVCALNMKLVDFKLV